MLSRKKLAIVMSLMQRHSERSSKRQPRRYKWLTLVSRFAFRGVKAVSGSLKLIQALLFLFFISDLSAEETGNNLSMKIRLVIGDNSATATLDDTAASRDFYNMLPMTLMLEDYASTEKIAYPERKLATTGAPEGYDPSAGDITYYAPWGNLALFYKDFSYSRGLIRLGEFDDGGALLKFRGKANARFEAVP